MVMSAVPILWMAAGHGAVTHPKPRQAIDGSIHPWNGPVPPYPVPFTGPNWCERPDADSDDPRKLSGANGQACFWFNNGCDIGCDECDGVSGQKIPCCVPKFIWNGTGNPPSWGGEGIVADPKYVASFNISKMRPTTVVDFGRKPTICDPKLRTINTNAACGAPDDFWHFTPWRWPGRAPVTDACGTAGGVLPGQPNGVAGASYTKTVNANVGDRGSRLPPLETGTQWTAGSNVEVSWNFKAWHGGGYTYRLCPADQTLTEACFQKMPLNFVGNSSLRWGGKGGEQLSFDPVARGWQVNTGTLPPGSMWRKFPIPRSVNEWNTYGAAFEPVCQESDACKNAHFKPVPNGVCKCSGDWNDAVEIVDSVYIPESLKPGKYVLGWRWDCEESTCVGICARKSTCVLREGAVTIT